MRVAMSGVVSSLTSPQCSHVDVPFKAREVLDKLYSNESNSGGEGRPSSNHSVLEAEEGGARSTGGETSRDGEQTIWP
jgi:hypothetical protein